MSYRAPDWVPDSAAKNAHAMKVAGAFDDGDGKIDDREWTAYQKSLGNTWTKEKGWSNGGQPQSSSSSSSSSSGTPSKVRDINNYDTTSYGAGHFKDGDRLSRADIKELHENQGFSKQEVIDYVENKYSLGTKGGGKAKSLLERYKQELMAKPAAPAATVAPEPAPTPTQGRIDDIRMSITPDMYQSNQSTKDSKNESSSNNNVIDIMGGDGRGNISISQGNSQSFENYQDNDIITNVRGNNNNVDSSQDNSIKNFGGSQSNNANAGGFAFANEDFLSGLPRRGTDFGSGGRNISIGQRNDQKFKNVQDNDIVTEVVGDNNNITSSQDNSIRNYGGNQGNLTMADFLRRVGL